jgi:hypothetical protein
MRTAARIFRKSSGSEKRQRRRSPKDKIVGKRKLKVKSPHRKPKDTSIGRIKNTGAGDFFYLCLRRAGAQPLHPPHPLRGCGALRVCFPVPLRIPTRLQFPPPRLRRGGVGEEHDSCAHLSEIFGKRKKTKASEPQRQNRRKTKTKGKVAAQKT